MNITTKAAEDIEVGDQIVVRSWIDMDDIVDVETVVEIGDDGTPWFASGHGIDITYSPEIEVVA